MTRRWVVVGAAALGLAAVPAVVGAVPVSPPATGLATLIGRMRASAVQPFQGYAVSSGSAGLPAIPQLGDVADLLNGDTQLRIWYGSSSHWRGGALGLGTQRRPRPPAPPRGGLGLRPNTRSDGGRGPHDPFLVSRFMEVSLAAPAAAVLTPPDVHGSMGYTVANGADISGPLTTFRFALLPDRLAGQPRPVTDSSVWLETPQGRFQVEYGSGIGTYGTGLATFLVLPLSRRAGFDVINRITRANGNPLTYPTGRGVQISTPLVSVLALHSDVSEQTYLMVGLVEPKLLRQAATELVTFPGGR